MSSEHRTRFAVRGRAYWSLTGALVLLVLVGFMAIGPVLRGAAWWWGMAAIATIVLISGAVFRRLRWPVALVPVSTVGVLILLLTLFFGAGTGLAWLIPLPATFDIWSEAAEAGALSIQQQAVPAVAYPGIVFLLCIGAGLIAVLIDAIAITLRFPALAGALILIPVAVPALITSGGTGVFSLVLTAGAYLLLLRVDVRTRRMTEAENPDLGRYAARTFGPERRGPGPVLGSIGVGAGAIVAALVLSTATPALSEGSIIQTRSSGVLFGTGVSPLIDLGQDLRRPEASPAMHYSTDADQHPYFKLLTLDAFSDTAEWVAGHAPVDPRNRVSRIGDPPGLGDHINRTPTRTEVQIDDVVSSWLPVPYPAESIRGLDGDWSWDETALTVSSNRSTTRGQHYVVRALAVEPTADQLRSAGRDYPADIAELTALPAGVPDAITTTAADVTGGTTNPYDAAVALQSYLRGSAFSYSTQAPVDEGYDGGGIELIAKFLDVKKGYCIHFASTMAVMARTLGIPARLALGYLPGESQQESFAGSTRWNVSSHDLHVWPELYFPGVGWVPFEPTSGRGSIPDYAQQTASEVAPSSAPIAGDNRRPENQGLSDAKQSTSANGAVLAGSLAWLGYAGLAALAMLVLALPFLVRRIERALRRRTAARGSPEAAWRELVATGIDHGIVAGETETARHLAARIGAVVPDDQALAALDRLLGALERERYAFGGSSGLSGRDLVDDLDVVIAAFSAPVSAPVRLRAALLPRSLWPSSLTPQRGTPSAA